MKMIFVVGARGIPDVEGGVEKNAEELFPRIAARGWRVVLSGLDTHIKSDSFRGVKLLRSPGRRVLKTDKLFSYTHALFQAFRLRPDIVHLSGLGAAVFLIAYKLMGCTVVVRYGSADYLAGKWGRLGRLGFRIAEYQLRFADAVIAVTPSLAVRLRSKNISRNVHVIGNAIDSNSAESPVNDPQEGDRYILAVGRVTPQKNIARLITAFKIFADAHPDMKLIIAGSIDDSTFGKQVEQLCDHRIIMLGLRPRKELIALYRGAHIFINASIHEGHSNAILEAISHNVPILLSDIPENRDFKLNSNHYFDPENIESIARALKRAAVRSEQYQVSSSNFLSWDEVAEQTEQVYQGMLAADGNSRQHTISPA